VNYLKNLEPVNDISHYSKTLVFCVSVCEYDGTQHGTEGNKHLISSTQFVTWTIWLTDELIL